VVPRLHARRRRAKLTSSRLWNRSSRNENQRWGAAMRVIVETRAEYEANQLPADIEFERAVTGKRGPWRVTLAGNTAWMNALTEYEGTFKNDPVNFVSAQLVVLARDRAFYFARPGNPFASIWIL
jgi:hypothetical protein